VGEGILQILGYYREETPPTVKQIIFRCADSYWHRIVTNLEEPRVNINMTKAIRLHYNCLKDILDQQQVAISWNPIPPNAPHAHMESTLRAAEMGVTKTGKKKYAADRNEEGLENLRELLRGQEAFRTETVHGFTQLDPDILSEASLYIKWRGFNVLQISEDEIGRASISY
jgi:hypothetical protein